MAKPKVKAPPAPESPDDLSREGLLFLLRMCVPFVSRHDLIRARWHELVQDSERASDAWKKVADEFEQVLKLPTPTQGGERAALAAQARIVAARERHDRAWSRSDRAYGIAEAFFDAHMDPPPQAPAELAETEA